MPAAPERRPPSADGRPATAVVLGGSVAGLLAARALAPFARVTVVER
ncbi:hypothetical protein G3I30_34250, partial [Actinospica acidiphila]|nr:hypothetical protein [Actinospica acidiphila]